MFARSFEDAPRDSSSEKVSENPVRNIRSATPRKLASSDLKSKTDLHHRTDPLLNIGTGPCPLDFFNVFGTFGECRQFCMLFSSPKWCFPNFKTKLKTDASHGNKSLQLQAQGAVRSICFRIVWCVRGQLWILHFGEFYQQTSPDLKTKSKIDVHRGSCILQ